MVIVLQTFQNEVQRKARDIDQMVALGEAFMNSCDVDQEVILDAINELKAKSQRISSGR